MRCHRCNQHKLHREFPYEALTDNCDHAPLHCLRCTVEDVEKNQQCSMCKEPVAIDNPKYQECVDTLKRLFPDFEEPLFIPRREDDHIIVSDMSGETVKIPYDENMSVFDLKREVQERFKMEPEKQRLFYHGKELEPSNVATLRHYEVQPSSTVNLIVVLYKIPDTLDNVIFDLLWDFPTRDSITTKEYLDASVLLYSKKKIKAVIDWKNRSHKKYTGVYHSGDHEDKENCTGHHKITVQIKNLHKSIDKLFFTLSAFESKEGSPTSISKYPNPRLHFFDERNPHKQLCDDSLKHVAESQAILMCCMCKTGTEKWQVLSLKRQCNGNVQDYEPIKKAVQEVIENEF